MVLVVLRLPFQLHAAGAAVLLGFQPHDIPILVGEGLLDPIGEPGQQSCKYFLTHDLEQLRGNRRWFNRARRVVAARWSKEERGQASRARTSPQQEQPGSASLKKNQRRSKPHPSISNQQPKH
jgi:hypothetical protein